VAFHYVHSESGAKEAAAEARTHDVEAHTLAADLSNLSETLNLVPSAEAAIGPLDILINNAGITFNIPFLEMQPAQFQKLYDVNVRAGFLLSQQAAIGMVRRGGGAICNLTSVHGLQGASEHAAYSGTKGAIIAQTRAMAVELAHQGVRVNAIAPGWINVENHARAHTDYDPEIAQRDAAARVPVGRYGKPCDIARLAVFLCSEDASFIVGQTVVSDGGTTALMSLFSDCRARSSAQYGRQYI
jgi:meso-butanediol dehydrogenase/(S,S)-butanediol dehydrogenase/diacetyl reductase